MDSEVQRMHLAIIAPFLSPFPAKASLGNSKSVTDLKKETPLSVPYSKVQLLATRRLPSPLSFRGILSANSKN